MIGPLMFSKAILSIDEISPFKYVKEELLFDRFIKFMIRPTIIIKVNIAVKNPSLLVRGLQKSIQDPIKKIF
jgi:hypothetical protein